MPPSRFLVEIGQSRWTSSKLWRFEVLRRNAVVYRPLWAHLVSFGLTFLIDGRKRFSFDSETACYFVNLHDLRGALVGLRTDVTGEQFTFLFTSPRAAEQAVEALSRSGFGACASTT